jgi:hypothetical protein
LTALTMPARPDQDVNPPPVPWRRIAWVTWRQHRFALAAVAVFLGAWALYLWFEGLRIRHAYAAAAGCRPASSLACGGVLSYFNYSYGDAALHSAVFLHTAPALIGAFAGAPVLARELETGTFRYAWTQGFGRWRWALGQLVPLAVLVAAAAWAFGLLFSWFYQPLFAEGQNTPFAPEVFDLRGVAFAGWTLATFAIGALAGMLIRRVVPAIAATLAAYTGLALVVGLFVRQHYAAPLRTSNPSVPGSAWIMSQWWTKSGRFAFTGWPSNRLLTRLCPSAGPYKQPRHVALQCMVRHGYTQWTSYEPVSRFWPFQWIEGGWLLALSVLLIALTIWLVRRRPA